MTRIVATRISAALRAVLADQPWLTGSSGTERGGGSNTSTARIVGDRLGAVAASSQPSRQPRRVPLIQQTHRAEVPSGHSRQQLRVLPLGNRLHTNDCRTSEPNRFAADP